MHRYSYSQLQKYATCPTLYKLDYVDCLVPLSGQQEHDLLYGSAIDAGLNEYYASGNLPRALAAFTLSYPPSTYPAALPYWSPGKTYENGMAALAAYADHYREEDRNWQVVAIQSEGMETADDDRTVKLDLVVKDTRDGLFYGVDNKTTGKYLDKDFNAKFEIHSQIRQYTDHVQKHYGECGGFYINALSFRHRTKAYTPRTGPDKGVQLPAGDWFAFKRMLYHPNYEAILAERANWDNWVAKIRADRMYGTWAYNTDQCVRGPIICPYHAICSRGYQWPRDEDLITGDYRQRCRVLVGGRRCWLDLAHEGDHDSVKPVQPEFEIEMDDNVEEAERA